MLFAKESGSFQSHSPSRAAVAKPRRGQRPRVLCGEAVSIWRVPLTLTLSHKGRGDGYRGRLRSANRPYSTPSIDPKPYPPRGEGIIYPGAMRFAYWHPTCLPQGGGDGYCGRLRSANRPYRLIAPYRLPQASYPHGAWAKPRGCRASRSRVKPSHLAAGAGDRLGSAKDAAAPDCRRHLAPLTIHEYAGPNGGRWSSYGTRLSGAIQIHEISDATIRIKWFFSFAAEWQPAVDPWPGCDGR